MNSPLEPRYAILANADRGATASERLKRDAAAVLLYAVDVMRHYRAVERGRRHVPVGGMRLGLIEQRQLCVAVTQVRIERPPPFAKAQLDQRAILAFAFLE